MKVVYTRQRDEKLTSDGKSFTYLWSRFSNTDHQKEYDDFLDTEIETDSDIEVFQLMFEL
jgi:hypothetical protein